MTSAQPPRLARWLLCRLVSGAYRESLLGDLDEQLTRGRSSLWYWRQVVSAIVLGIAHDLRAHPVITMRSVGLVWVLVIGWIEVTLALYLWVSETWMNAWPDAGFNSIIFLFWHPFGAGLCLVWCVGAAASGWIVARQVGRHRVAMILACTVVLLPVAYWANSTVWLQPERFLGGPARLWVPIYLQALISTIEIPIACLLGGLWRAEEVSSHVPAS